MKTRARNFFIQFEDETLEQAIKTHPFDCVRKYYRGFKNIEEAKGEAEAVEAGKGRKYKVLSSKLEVVFEGQTSGGKAATDKPKVLVVVSGGVVQSVHSNNEKLEVEILDYDDMEEEKYSDKAQEAEFKLKTKELKHTNY